MDKRKSSAMVLLTTLLSLFLLSILRVNGFSNKHYCRKPISSCLHGIAEWRDLSSSTIHDDDDLDETRDVLKHATSARRAQVFCVTSEQIVLQGEKKYFQFHSNDELRLFQRALDRNHGIFALGVIIGEDEDGDDIMMNKLQLMEIKEYNMDLGVDFGIFCTAQAVGRASLLSLLDNNTDPATEDNDYQNEPLIAICEERFEDEETYFSIEDVNGMAKEVLEVMSKLSEKEQDSIESCNHEVKIVYDVNTDEEKDDNDDEETRKDRFARAYLEALETDTRGYISSGPLNEGILCGKKMNAISWAAFSSGLIPSEDSTMRLHAFDQDRLADRLKLASFWLADVVEEVEQESNSR